MDLVSQKNKVFAEIRDLSWREAGDTDAERPEQVDRQVDRGQQGGRREGVSKRLFQRRICQLLVNYCSFEKAFIFRK